MKLKSSLIVATFLLGTKLFASNFIANPAGGDYNSTSTWTLFSGGADSDGIPDANDNITIGSGITVTVTVDNQACLALTISNGGTLTFSNVDLFTTFGVVTISGTMNGTFSGPSASFVRNSTGITGTAGTINITGNMRFLATGNISGVTINNTGNILINAGATLGIYGNVTLLGGSVDGMGGGTLYTLAGCVLTVENQMMATSGSVITNTNSTIVFDGSTAYSLGITSIDKTIIRGTGIKTTSNTATTIFKNTVTIDAGATLAQSATQTITWIGQMTNNGTFSGSTKNINYTNASWVNNGIFTHAGVFYFSGTSVKTLSGTGTTSTFSSLYIQNANVTKSINTTLVNGVLQTIAKDFNNSAGTLTIKGSYLSTSGGTLTANSVGNTVILTYPNGPVPATTSGYYNLSIAGTFGTKTLTANTIVANNFTMSTGNTLNVNNFNLSVAGNWTSSGTFIGSTGKTVTFDGSSPQTVSNTVGTTTFTGLTINNNAGVTLTSGTYTLSEVLTVSNGTFNTGGRPFTMTSTATKTARIAPITGSGAIAGNFTIQRFISARDTTFADFSSPVQNSTFADWDAELPAINYTSTPPTQEASGATYDEAADVYVPITSSATSLSPGVGYEVFLSGDFSYANFPATTMTTVGVPNQGDQDLSSLVSATAQGWNLVGNPFASSVAWSTIYTTSGGATSGMFDYIEMYDYTIGDWNGFTSADGIEIGATQGFWVYGDFSGPMTLIVPEASKTTASNSTIKTSTKPSFFTLKLENTKNAFAHNFKIAANNDASDGLDKKDIPFRNSPNKATPIMYSLVDGKKVNVNTFNLANNSYSLPLKTQVNVSGNYKITASGLATISEYTCIQLQDNLTGQIIDLNEGNGYCFTMNTTDSPDRFIVHFNKDNNNCKSAIASAPQVNLGSQIEILPTAQGNLINFNLSETTNSTISVMNVLGQTIVEGINIDANTQSINIALPEGFSGLYFIKIESAKGNVTKKFVRK